jgi:hypothetical protein
LGIHRSHTVVGQAVGNNEYGNNFGSLRKYMQRKGTPFIWPGSKAQWNGISDVTDAKY